MSFLFLILIIQLSFSAAPTDSLKLSSLFVLNNFLTILRNNFTNYVFTSCQLLRFLSVFLFSRIDIISVLKRSVSENLHVKMSETSSRTKQRAKHYDSVLCLQTPSGFYHKCCVVFLGFNIFSTFLPKQFLLMNPPTCNYSENVLIQRTTRHPTHIHFTFHCNQI